MKRNLWEYGEVLELLPSAEDGKVRSVRLRIGHWPLGNAKPSAYETTRPIVKLHPLISAKELRPDSQQNDVPSQEGGNGSSNQLTIEQPTEPRDEPMIDQTVNLSDRAEDIVPSRPQRAAKAAGRDKVKKWTTTLQEE